MMENRYQGEAYEVEKAGRELLFEAYPHLIFDSAPDGTVHVIYGITKFITLWPPFNGYPYWRGKSIGGSIIAERPLHVMAALRMEAEQGARAAETKPERRRWARIVKMLSTPATDAQEAAKS